MRRRGRQAHDAGAWSSVYPYIFTLIVFFTGVTNTQTQKRECKHTQAQWECTTNTDEEEGQAGT